MVADLGKHTVGNNLYKMDVSELPNGIYTYTMDLNGRGVTRKFVVSR
jgi:hypothetical protein